MLLSFSIPTMRQMIALGLRERAGEDIGAARVKRQTIRRRGPRAEKLLAHDPLCRTQPYDLHLWWKSRTAERELIGTVAGGSRIYPISILHSEVVQPDGWTYPIIRIDGPRGWRSGDAMIFWSEAHGGDSFKSESYADGFDSPQAFRDFFVPHIGDEFHGVIFKW